MATAAAPPDKRLHVWRCCRFCHPAMTVAVVWCCCRSQPSGWERRAGCSIYQHETGPPNCLKDPDINQWLKLRCPSTRRKAGHACLALHQGLGKAASVRRLPWLVSVRLTSQPAGWIPALPMRKMHARHSCPALHLVLGMAAVTRQCCPGTWHWPLLQCCPGLLQTPWFKHSNALATSCLCKLLPPLRLL